MLAASDAAIVKHGTGTLEAALLGCPMVAAARVSPITAALARHLVSVPSLVLPNLLVGRLVVPELYQGAADPARVADAVLPLLAGPARDAQLAAFADVAEALGEGGAAQRVASMAREMVVARAAH